METLVINIPEAKSDIVKQVLHGLGIDVPGFEKPVKGDYQKKLLEISVWSDEDIKNIEAAGRSFNDLKAEEW